MKQLGKNVKTMYSFKMFFRLIIFTEKKCKDYIKNNLRAPSITLVKKWGKQLKLSDEDIKNVNSNLLIRHQLGK
jgi:hypothetical protein